MSRVSKIIKAVKPGNSANIRVILLCIVAATTFWFFNALNENYSTTLRYPLHFVYDQDAYIAVEPLPEAIQINVTGLGWNLFRKGLGIKVSPLEIPLEDPKEIKKIVAASVPALITDQLNELQLNYVMTDTLFINIDSRIEKKYALAIDSGSISLEPRYRIVSPIQFSPDTVSLTGPGGLLAKLPDTIYVQIPQQDIDESFKEEISISLPDASLIQRDPPLVSVRFDVEEFVSQEVQVPLHIENIPDKAFIETDMVKVSYKIPISKAEEQGIEETQVVADFEKMNLKDSTITPVLQHWPSIWVDVLLDTTRIKVRFNE